MQEAKLQQQAADKAKALKGAPREELKSRAEGGGGKAVSSKAKSIKAIARSSATSAKSSKVGLFFYAFQTGT